jgi:hypothetical protein
VSKKLLGPPPSPIRFFLGTPLYVFAEALMWVARFVIGSENMHWQLLNEMYDAGVIDIMTEDEYKKRYGKENEEGKE